MLSLRVREPACTLVWLSLRTTSGSAARLGGSTRRIGTAQAGVSSRQSGARIPAAFAFAWRQARRSDVPAPLLVPHCGNGSHVRPGDTMSAPFVKRGSGRPLSGAHAGLRSVICADSGARCLGGEDHVLSVGGVDGHLVQTGEPPAGLLPRVGGDVTGRWPPRGRPDAAGSSRCSGCLGRRWRRRRAAVADPEQQPRHERR